MGQEDLSLEYAVLEVGCEEMIITTRLGAVEMLHDGQHDR